MRALFGIALIAGTLIGADALAAEPLGRLFFTPEQRSALEAGKRTDEPRMKRVPAPRGPREIKLDGLVTRSDGESTIWINGRPLDATRQPDFSATASSSEPAAVQVRSHDMRSTVQLRVGQRLERATGAIAEPYESVSRHAGAGTTADARERKQATGSK